jgi:hypothetical protein
MNVRGRADSLARIYRIFHAHNPGRWLIASLAQAVDFSANIPWTDD